METDKNNVRTELTKQEGQDLLGVSGLCNSVSENRVEKASVRTAQQILPYGPDELSGAS